MTQKIVSSSALRRQAYGVLFRLGLPVLVTQLGQIVVSMADTMMVGAYGIRELASAAFVNNLFMIPLVMQMGFAGGVTPLIGALYGARKFDEAGSMLRVAIRQNLIVGAIVVLVMSALYFALPYMGQPPELLPLIKDYYLIVLLSVAAASLFYPCMQMALGVTDTVSPMLVIIVANLVNVGGNYILIFGHFGAPELGLDGAGISTLAARILSTVAMVWIVVGTRRYRPYRTGLHNPVPVAGQHRRVWRTSVPISIQSGVECSLWGLGAVVSGWFGKEQLAAYQVVLIMGQLGFMVYMSFTTALSVRVANLTGTGDKEGIMATAVAALRMVLGLATLSSLTFMLFGEPILHLFTEDESVISIGVSLVFPLVLYQYADAVQMTYVNALRGTSRVRPLIPISVSAYILVGATVMLFLASGMNMASEGVYYSFSVALAVAAVLYRRSFLRTQRQ